MERIVAFRQLRGGGSGRRYAGVDGWERITSVTCRIRFVLGLVAIGLTPIVPVAPRRLTWLGFMALIYLPYALAARVLGPRWQGRLLGFIIAGADLRQNKVRPSRAGHRLIILEPLKGDGRGPTGGNLERDTFPFVGEAVGRNLDECGRTSGCEAGAYERSSHDSQQSAHPSRRNF